MYKTGIFFTSLLVIILGAFVFKTSYEHHKVSKELKMINFQIAESEENISLLHAEWSLINSPQNIQAMCNKYLPDLTHTHYQLASLSHLDSIIPDQENISLASRALIQTASNK